MYIKLYLINFSTEFEFPCGNMHDVTLLFAKKTAFVITWFKFLFRDKTLFYKHGHNIMRMFDVLPNFLFTTSERKPDC